jgi:hypothetical protein
MFRTARSPRRRDLNPSLDSLEGRALLNAAMPRPAHLAHVDAHVAHAKHGHEGPQAEGPTITFLGAASAGGYTFLNFDGPNAGTNAGAGTNDNGISNSGTAVGFDIDNNGGFHNFTVNPLRRNSFQELNIENSTTANAFGVNRAGVVVGTDGNGNAFYLSRGKLTTFIPLGGSAATAFGINDGGTIVGQYTLGNEMPGFIRLNARKAIRLDAPNTSSGTDIVNAQSINNKGVVVGFYAGNNDGPVHGFWANERDARNGELTGTAIADPTIPTVAGEPGATFVFSQILSVNDKGIAVGYYGDSTLSQHGFILNLHTGQYTFLDDPSEAFDNGVEVTQITGITNSGEFTGFYTDANGVAHAFVASTSMM